MRGLRCTFQPPFTPNEENQAGRERRRRTDAVKDERDEDDQNRLKQS